MSSMFFTHFKSIQKKWTEYYFTMLQVIVFCPLLPLNVAMQRFKISAFILVLHCDYL